MIVLKTKKNKYKLTYVQSYQFQTKYFIKNFNFSVFYQYWLKYSWYSVPEYWIICYVLFVKQNLLKIKMPPKIYNQKTIFDRCKLNPRNSIYFNHLIIIIRLFKKYFECYESSSIQTFLSRVLFESQKVLFESQTCEHVKFV